MIDDLEKPASCRCGEGIHHTLPIANLDEMSKMPSFNDAIEDLSLHVSIKKRDDGYKQEKAC